MEPIKGEGGKQWARMFVYTCLSCAQLSGRDSHAQIHTGNAGRFYTYASTSRLDFGVVCRKWCVLFHIHIMLLQSFLPSTAPILTSRAALEPENFKLSDGVLRSGNGEVAAELCLEEPIWPPLPKKGLAQWWGRPVP